MTQYQLPVIRQIGSDAQVYTTLGRSADLTVGSDYYSSRGFAETATFRYRGQGLDFVNVHYSGLLDHGYTTAGGVISSTVSTAPTSMIRTLRFLIVATPCT